MKSLQASTVHIKSGNAFHEITSLKHWKLIWIASFWGMWSVMNMHPSCFTEIDIPLKFTKLPYFQIWAISRKLQNKGRKFLFLTINTSKFSELLIQWHPYNLFFKNVYLWPKCPTMTEMTILKMTENTKTWVYFFYSSQIELNSRFG